MKVIICGAGQVGYNLAKYLSGGKSNVTLIDIRPDLIEKATNSLDVRGIIGFASHPDTLADAGAADADLLIAVTQIDEINMIACQIGHSVFGVTTKVARVREQAYLDDRWSQLFAAEHLPIDRLISPEREVAQSIERLLEVPGAFDVFPLPMIRPCYVGYDVLLGPLPWAHHWPICTQPGMPITSAAWPSAARVNRWLPMGIWFCKLMMSCILWLPAIRPMRPWPCLGMRRLRAAVS